MGVDGCGQLAKCILILFSVLFAIIGLGMAGLGIGLRLSADTRGLFDVDLKTQQFVIFVVVLIVLGGLMVLVSIFGFHGACSENISSLRVFAILVAIIAGVEIGAGVLVYMRSTEVSQHLGEVYASIYAQFLNTRDSSLGTTLKIIHQAFDCCGVGGGLLEVFVRNTCPDKSLWDAITNPGCPHVIMNLFEDKAPMVMGFFLASGAIMITALVCSSLLIKGIKSALSAPTYVLLTTSTISHIPPAPAVYPALTVTVPDAEQV
ncbi:hypothetical protein ACEWY4_002757 [Coilia grayii]|uniref:Tetraspanin n=1 Tax=Coilia grayii TaxID=363190 RepID=A0ABD1KPY4_9TELE